MKHGLPELSTVTAIGAHPDDIEIGAGGTISRIAAEQPGTRFSFIIATGTEERRDEASASARSLLGDRVEVHLYGADDGMLPYTSPRRLKEWVREALPEEQDLILAPWRGDRHQDHRFMAELAWQLCRSATILEYGIPKWETEKFAPNLYVELGAGHANRKLDHLQAHFPSQHGKPWYRREKFDADLLAHGIRAGCMRAEGFVADKLVM